MQPKSPNNSHPNAKLDKEAELKAKFQHPGNILRKDIEKILSKAAFLIIFEGFLLFGLQKILDRTMTTPRAWVLAGAICAQILLILLFVYFWRLFDAGPKTGSISIAKTPEPNPAIQNDAIPKAAPTDDFPLIWRTPSFDKSVKKIRLSIFGSSTTYDVANLKKKITFLEAPNTPQIVAPYGKLYINKQNVLCFDAKLLSIKDRGPNTRAVTSNNALEGLPSNWDYNFNQRAFEVVNEKCEPVYQIYFRSADEVFINGYFHGCPVERAI